eukprot:3580447-Pyramimonas_sp.AAC.1
MKGWPPAKGCTAPLASTLPGFVCTGANPWGTTPGLSRGECLGASGLIMVARDVQLKNLVRFLLVHSESNPNNAVKANLSR